MKTSTIAPAVLACLVPLTLINAGPILSNQLSSRSITDASVDALYFRDIEAEIIARAADLEARGNNHSSKKKEEKKKKKEDDKKKEVPRVKALYPVGSNKSESPTGQFRKLTAGRGDDYFGDYEAVINGVDNPAAGKGNYKKKEDKRDLHEFELEARGNGSGGSTSTTGNKKKKDIHASYPVGNTKSEKPIGTRKQTAGRDDDYFGNWQSKAGGRIQSSGGRNNPSRRDLYDLELEARDLYEARDFLDAELEGRDLFAFELEARDLYETLEARDVLEAALEARDLFEFELEARDLYEAELEARDFIDELD
ncbi:hypothetical protein DXG03_001212 [Asterophora parasitica]|uniref:Uncharacterized protein n=1 Tax=Asterophora parasitica TaxID=117018 RepID=A0A9P7G3G0_9AGAR|nr:hypothetical protein DXG03_001212 [Asterophora parasitica]